MGRHSSGRSGPFIRSFFGWLLPWLLIAVVVGVGIWMVADFVGRDGGARTVSEELPPQEEPTSEAPSETLSETPEPTQTKEEEPKKEPVRLITKGITIQVLNGASDPEAGDLMAARLAKLGFQVVTVEFSSTPYKETTVLWSFPQAEEAARALASKYDWEAKLKPANLSETVSMHVVVGRDEAGV